MGIETFVGTYIDGLNTSNPVTSDNYSTADDHLRGIKLVLQNTFPNISGAVTLTQSQINDAARKSAANTFTEIQTISKTGSYLQDLDCDEASAAQHFLRIQRQAASKWSFYISADGSGNQLGVYDQVNTKTVLIIDPNAAQVLLTSSGLNVGGHAVPAGAAAVLTQLLTVDGTGSNLDSDTVDGYEATALLDKDNQTGLQEIGACRITADTNGITSQSVMSGFSFTGAVWSGTSNNTCTISMTSSYGSDIFPTVSVTNTPGSGAGYMGVAEIASFSATQIVVNTNRLGSGISADSFNLCVKVSTDV